jgi:hypothetical protein
MEQFANERNLSVYQLRNWATRFRAEDGESMVSRAPPRVEMAEVMVRDNSAYSARPWVEIHAGDLRVRVYADSEEVAVMKAVRALKNGASSC